MVAVPFFTAVTLPLADTVATLVLELVHFTVSVLFFGVRVAFKVKVPFFLRVIFVLFKVTFLAGTLTVTLQVAFLPLVVLAVMVAVPLPTAVITPLEDTLATFSLELVHFMVSVLFLGVKVAFKVSFLP